MEVRYTFFSFNYKQGQIFISVIVLVQVFHFVFGSFLVCLVLAQFMVFYLEQLNLRYNGLPWERGGEVGGCSVKAAQIPTEPSSSQCELTSAAFAMRPCLAPS